MTRATSRTRQQQLARWARRAPGYRTAVDRVLPAVRRNATLTDVVFRVFLPRHGVGTLPVPLVPGRHLSGRDTALLPVVGVVGLGLSEDQVGSLVEEVATLQRAERSFRVLLVLDRPAFALARSHGYAVEVLVPQAAWAGHPQGTSPPVPWEDYLGRRLADVLDHYQLWHLARSTPEGHLDPLDEVLLRNVAARLPASLQVDPAPVTRGDP
ncbi:hypothetical protein [Ornithinimicrobium cerasi]|uniref:Uncharacterized protein n=1 Tax=Ornithinimicrobium cerasi TaxID=2248773 RepID=A0A285VVN0_9MICO|nr:hypothetical protein [Ornithinimicrobium cerasi]SOC58094.1 hypothetical protein SAMN05421879_12211 [Ornithinimicrobium cerasi]